MSDLRTIIRSRYQFVVAMADIPNDLKASLKTHERVPRFIDQLAKELSAVKDLNRDTIHMCVDDLTLRFVTGIVQQAREKMMSAAERSSIMAKRKAMEDQQKLFDQLLTREVENDQGTKEGHRIAGGTLEVPAEVLLGDHPLV